MNDHFPREMQGRHKALYPIRKLYLERGRKAFITIDKVYMERQHYSAQEKQHLGVISCRKLKIYQSLHVLILAYGHEFQVMTNRMRLWL